jgi:PKD repeat protein
MKNSKRLLVGSSRDLKKKPTKRKRKWKLIAIALYITFLLLSTIPYLADRSIEPNMVDSYEYHLKYRKDGRQSHYYVERVNTSQIGRIDLIYTTDSNTLEVDVENIKVLNIYCRSMYEDECRKVFGIDPSDNSNYYKWYFIEKNHLNVNIDSEYEIEELSFIDTPFPYKVLVNNIEWKEGLDYFYSTDYTTALSNVPVGHTNVDIYFKPENGIPPVAILNASRTLVPINYNIAFDASNSYDSDGLISRYIVDYGDGIYTSEDKSIHSYSQPGNYGVVLTVRDDNYLIDHAFLNITVVESSNLPEIQGVVPHQIKPEDSPPWSLNLTIYEPIASAKDIEFFWYLTGEDKSLYAVVGENSSDDKLIFSPEPDAFGNDLTKLWLRSSENVTVSQPLWINITPVNDPPTIHGIPDLVLHYNDPYTFNYEPYIDDKETPKNELNLTIYDGFEEEYITINGLNATFEYPQSLVSETIYVTVMVSDGDAIAQDVISIQITSDYVPKLTKSLPDVWLYEGTTKYNVFNLDDYFIDPDNDAIYFSYGQSNLEITIHQNHSVDFSATSEWTGIELVTFRARDPMGAIAEDSIVVTVLPVNDPPSISGIPDFLIRYDNDYRFDLTPYVHDNDNSTNELVIIPSDSDHIRLDIRNNMVIILNYPEEFLGQSIPIRLTVSDGLDFDSQEVTVTVTEDFPPELLSPIPDIVFLEDQLLTNAFDLDYYFLDIDGDVLYYTTGNEFITITINPDHTVDLSSPPDWFGVELVYFRATDPTGALQQDLVSVTVLPVNDAPKLLVLPAQYGNESERWILDLEPYIIDVDNNISEMEISVDNEYVVVSGCSLVFLGSRGLGKQVEVSVADGQFTTSQTMEIHLRVKKQPRNPTMWDLLVNLLPILIIIILIILTLVSAVYYKKSRFTAEEVFLIHKGGTLITHLSHEKQANVDDIIFSGMFTAVQDFIRDTFVSEDSDDVEDNQWALDELKLGENNILIERSDNTYLAVIFSGDGSKRLRRIVMKLLNKIETKYEKILPLWDGNINKLKGTKKILSVLIKSYENPEIDDKKGKSLLDITKKSELISKPEPKPSQSPFQQLQAYSSSKSSSEPMVSEPIRKAKQITESKKKVPSKELPKCASDHTGATRPGLPAWSINKNRSIKWSKVKNDKLPNALNIQTPRSGPKTVVIQKGQLSINGKSSENGLSNKSNLNPPVGLDGNLRFHPESKFKIDPSRSLLEQLGEIGEKQE